MLLCYTLLKWIYAYEAPTPKTLFLLSNIVFSFICFLSSSALTNQTSYFFFAFKRGYAGNRVWEFLRLCCSLACSLALFISTRHTRYIRSHLSMTSQMYREKNLSYANSLAFSSLSGEIFEHVFLISEESRKQSHENWKQPAVQRYSLFLYAPSRDFKWSFLAFLRSASIYIYCVAREVEIFLFCFSCRVNRVKNKPWIRGSRYSLPENKTCAPSNSESR